MTIDELVYDWNTIEPSLTAPNRHIGIDDETGMDDEPGMGVAVTVAASAAGVLAVPRARYRLSPSDGSAS